MWIIEDNILGRWTQYLSNTYETEQEAQIELAKLALRNPDVMFRIVEVK